MEPRTRNCFVSYHHEREQDYILQLREFIKEMRASDYSLKHDIGHLNEDTIYRKVREKMRSCSITVVLVGDRSGHRKWIDWELWASLRSYDHPTDIRRSFKPNGLLAIFLPTQKHSIPDRLRDNLHSGYAISMDWKDVSKHFENKLDEAYENRMKALDKIDNSRPRLSRNYLHLLGFKL